MEYQVFAIVSTIIGAVWGHALYLSNRFSSMGKETDAKFDKILTTITEKIEYHERHDDRRFSEIQNNLWEVRLQNALGHPPLKPRTRRKSEESGNES